MYAARNGEQIPCFQRRRGCTSQNYTFVDTRSISGFLLALERGTSTFLEVLIRMPIPVYVPRARHLLRYGLLYNPYENNRALVQHEPIVQVDFELFGDVEDSALSCPHDS
ncbi:uncharacterized protein LOC111255025 [Varroa destructor]|uniref:Uncharacterized protein n=1 Tax=Varroa destructor TaxID=109461 RepID=A0A7M7KV14_VARDE|nr:uncharacterized protein LOC111255025 [Varroa destructor]